MHMQHFGQLDDRIGKLVDQLIVQIDLIRRGLLSNLQGMQRSYALEVYDEGSPLERITTEGTRPSPRLSRSLMLGWRSSLPNPLYTCVVAWGR